MFVSKFISFGIKSGTIGKVVSLFFVVWFVWRNYGGKAKTWVRLWDWMLSVMFLPAYSVH